MKEKSVAAEKEESRSPNHRRRKRYVQSGKKNLITALSRSESSQLDGLNLFFRSCYAKFLFVFFYFNAAPDLCVFGWNLNCWLRLAAALKGKTKMPIVSLPDQIRKVFRAWLCLRINKFTLAACWFILSTGAHLRNSFLSKSIFFGWNFYGSPTNGTTLALLSYQSPRLKFLQGDQCVYKVNLLICICHLRSNHSSAAVESKA